MPNINYVNKVSGAAFTPDDANEIKSVVNQKADIGHNHAIADIVGLQTALDGKLSNGSFALANHNHDGVYQPVGSYAPASHTHAVADVTGLQAALDGKAASNHNHDGVYQPVGNYSLVGHSHVIGNISGLQSALDAKASTSHTHSLANLLQDGATDGQVIKWNQTAGAWQPAADLVGEGGGGAGVTSVNTLTGDVVLDHTHVGAAPSSHSHAIADVTGLQAALDGKASSTHNHDGVYQAAGNYASGDHNHDGVYQPAGSYASATHSHPISDVTGLQTALDGKQAAGSYAAASHTHAISEVVGLQTALDDVQFTITSFNAADVNGETDYNAYTAGPNELVVLYNA